MEDLILLFLVVILLVSTVVSTREHMKTKKKKEPPPMSKEKSMEIVTAALQKKGPKGTLAVFDEQIQKMEDLAAHDNDKDE